MTGVQTWCSSDLFSIIITVRRSINVWTAALHEEIEDFAKGTIAEIGNLMIVDLGSGLFGIIIYNGSNTTLIVGKGLYDVGWHNIKIIKNGSHINVLIDDEIVASQNINDFRLEFSDISLGLHKNIDIASAYSVGFSFNGYVSNIEIFHNGSTIFDLKPNFNRIELFNASRILADPIRPTKFWTIYENPYRMGMAYFLSKNHSINSINIVKESPVRFYLYINNITSSTMIVSYSYDPRWIVKVFVNGEGVHILSPE